MKPETKELISVILALYFGISILIWVIRVSVGGACEHRYMDYVFPIAKLHCKVTSDN